MKSNKVSNELPTLAGREDLHRRAATPGQARRGRCRAEDQNHRDRQHDKLLQVWDHGRGSARIEPAYPAPFMVNVILPCHFIDAARNDRGPSGPSAFKGAANGQVSSRSVALGATGFSTCPHRRHSRRASHFTMFIPHFGHGGRISKQVNACSLSAGSFARSAGKRDRSSGGCGQRLPSRRTARNGSLRHPLLLSAADRGENLALND